MRSETLHAALPLAILAGLALSLFAAAETLDPALRAACSVSPFFSCAKVDQSAYTTTFGIPDYLIGIGGFVIMFALDIQVYRVGRGRWLDLLTLFSVLGLALSVYFAWVELAVIGAFCLVCFSSYLCNGAVLVLALQLRRRSSGSGRSARPAVPADDA
ncbi:MAG TPA: vitamin K epoxide reductase family protein [Thermoplasmata archaeon]|nr:vitamin K epoxide reductase family protein [Thermoplasmata archaeon]